MPRSLRQKSMGSSAAASPSLRSIPVGNPLSTPDTNPQPPTTNRQPLTVNHQPSTTNHQLPTTNPQPSFNETVIQRSSIIKAGDFFYGYNTPMEFFFPEDNLTRAVPEETRIGSLSAQPYSDGRRLRVNLEITPFQKRPYIEITLTDSNGDEVASTSIVEPMSWKLEFTMHIRGELNNPYSLNARLYYPEGPSMESLIYSFDVEPPRDDPQPDSD